MLLIDAFDLSVPRGHAAILIRKSNAELLLHSQHTNLFLQAVCQVVISISAASTNPQSRAISAHLVPVQSGLRSGGVSLHC